MTHHACFAVPNEGLDVVIVDDNKSMQGILRSVLISMKVKRIRVYDNAESALHAMLREPPNLILTEWRLGRVGAYQFLRMIRARFMDPLCFVPVIIVSMHATRGTIERSMKAGAHLFLVKPVSPAVLMQRIGWLQKDERQFILGPKGLFEIEGVAERLRLSQDRSKALMRAANEYLKRDALADFEDWNGTARKTAAETNAERWAAYLKKKEAGSTERLPDIEPDERAAAQPTAFAATRRVRKA